MADNCGTRLLDPEVRKKLFGDREIPDDVVKKWLKGAEEIKDAYDQGHLDTPNFNRAMNDYITERRTTAEVQALVELSDKKKMKSARRFLRQEAWKGDAVEGFHAMLTKSVRMGNESALSISAKERGMLAKYTDFLRADMVEADTLKLAISGDMDEQIAKALAAIQDGGKPPADIPLEAKKIAETMHTVEMMAFKDQQDAGLPTKFLKKRVTLQTHDAAVIKNTGFDKWYADVQALSPDVSYLGTKALTPDGHRKIFQGIYGDIVAGRYGMMDTVADGQVVDALAPGRLSEQVSASRSIVFSPENQVKYMKMYGDRRTLMQALYTDLARKSKQTAMFERLGDKPRENFVTLIDREIRRLEKSTDEAKNAQAGRLRKQRNRLIHEFDQVAGSLSAPANENLAKLTQAIGSMEVVSKLGNLGIRSVANFAGAFADIKTTTGKSFGGEILAMTRETMSAIPESSRKVWSKRYADITMVMNNEIRERLAGNGGLGRVVGMSAKIADFQLKINGHHIMNDAFRTGISMVNLMEWADHTGKAFSEIPPHMQAGLLQAGINKDTWPLFQFAVRETEGRRLVSPEAFGRDQEFPLDMVERAMAASKFDGSVPAFLRGIENNIHAYLIQRGDVATTTAGPREASALNLGTQNGTFEGTFMRLFTRFKSFTAQSISIMRTFSNSTPNEKLLERGILASKKDSSVVGLFAQYMILGAGIAYMGDTLIRAASGREVNSPSDPRTWIDAFAKSGAGGLQVDFFSGQWDKYSFLEAAVGPTFAQLNPLAKATNQILNGNPDRAGSTVSRIARNYIPFQQMIGVKLAMDHVGGQYIQEMLEPGYAKRQQLKRLTEERKAE